MIVSYKTILPADRIKLNDKSISSTHELLKIKLHWVKDLIDKKIKLSSIEDLPDLYSNYYVEYEKQFLFSTAINSLNINETTKTITIFY